MTSTASDKPVALVRVLGPVQTTASGVGIIIGAGIYVLLGSATKTAGTGVWLSFALAGILSALTALSYAELSSMFPRSSAEFEFTRQVAPPWVAFLVGWVMVAGLVIASATISIGFTRNLAAFVSLPEKPTAIALLIAEGALVAVGLRHSSRLTVVLAAVQIGGLAAVIFAGLSNVGDVHLTRGTTPGGVLSGAALVFFAFIGFDEVITLSDETRDASYTIPRALLASLAVSTVLYVAVAIVAVSTLGAGGVAAADRPLSEVMETALGPGAARIISAVATVSTVNTSLLALTAGSRMFFGMAEANALPRSLAHINRHTRAPVRAAFFAVLVAVVFVVIGDLEVIASVTDLAIYAVFIVVNLIVIVLRVRSPQLVRPFRIPGSIGRIPILPVLGAAVVAVMIPQLSTRALGLGAGLLASGVVAHLLLTFFRARRSDPEGGVGESGVTTS